ncbi:hypothetical protein [Streptomyces sp. NPDC023327]|uniref:hypothetical protein n=1 Tax=Streptomyces sp. NPDC023327 TaxID=3157088 RepID=UPI00340E2474
MNKGAEVGKKGIGRKWSILVDTTGLTLAVLVTAAAIQDSVVGGRLLNRLAADDLGIRKGMAGRGYCEYLVGRAARLGIVRRTLGTRGFIVLPRRIGASRPGGRPAQGPSYAVTARFSVRERVGVRPDAVA